MSLLQRLRQSRRGSVAMVIAGATPVLIGSLGLAVDSIQWSLAKRQLQRQADSAAIAGAYALAQGANVQGSVTIDLARNTHVALTEAPTIENAPTAGAFAGDTRAVRVRLVSARALPFSGILLDEPVPVAAEATASMVANGQYCALSLESQPVVGINMSGNTTVDLGCGMATNSPAANAVNAGGSSRITASPISAVGGLQPSTNYVSPTQLIPYSVPQQDPYRNLPNPSVSGGSAGNVNSNQTRTLNPGTYSSMNLQGTVTLNPGTYFINGGDFSVGSQARVTGNGITIVLTSQTAANNPNSIGQVKMNGGATLNITAPNSGTYAGILIYQDRRAANSNQSNKINGNSSSLLRGAIYFPAQEVEFTGTNSTNVDCVQLVARRLTFIGNSKFRNICPGRSASQAFLGTAVRLVG